MKKMKYAVLLLLFALFPSSVICSGQPLFPEPSGEYVCDYAGVLRPEEVSSISRILKKNHEENRIHGMVVIVKTHVPVIGNISFDKYPV